MILVWLDLLVAVPLTSVKFVNQENVPLKMFTLLETYSRVYTRKIRLALTQVFLAMEQTRRCGVLTSTQVSMKQNGQLLWPDQHLVMEQARIQM